MAGIVPLIQKVVVYLPVILLTPYNIHMLIRGIGSDKLGIDMWLPFDARPSPIHEIIIIIQVQAVEILSVCLFICLPVLTIGRKVQSVGTSNIKANILSHFHPPPIIKHYVRMIHLILYSSLLLG
jgi:hypothetical protein